MDRKAIISQGVALVSLIPWESIMVKRGDKDIDRIEEMLERKRQRQQPQQPPIAAIPQQTIPAQQPEDKEVQDVYSGTSQISAEGKACIPCGTNHFQTVAGGLSEAIRFARNNGIKHDEVLNRIHGAEEELSTFERWDGSPDKVSKLTGDEKALMNDMLNSTRELRHQLSDIKNLDDLYNIASQAENISKDFTRRRFKMQLANMSTKEKAKKVDEYVTEENGINNLTQEQKAQVLDKAVDKMDQEGNNGTNQANSDEH